MKNQWLYMLELDIEGYDKKCKINILAMNYDRCIDKLTKWAIKREYRIKDVRLVNEISCWG